MLWKYLAAVLSKKKMKWENKQNIHATIIYIYENSNTNRPSPRRDSWYALAEPYFVNMRYWLDRTNEISSTYHVKIWVGACSTLCCWILASLKGNRLKVSEKVNANVSKFQIWYFEKRESFCELWRFYVILRIYVIRWNILLINVWGFLLIR